MGDNFETLAAGLESPAQAAADVTVSNTVDLPTFSRAIYIGVAGNLKVDMVGGGTVTYLAVPAGDFFPIRARRVYDTGTTATDMIAVW